MSPFWFIVGAWVVGAIVGFHLALLYWQYRGWW